MKKKLLLLIAMLVLVAAACADSDSEPSADEAPTAPPGALAACIETEPDCNDTVQIEPGDTPPPAGDDAQDLPDVVADLTVSQAMEATGFATVTGSLFDDGSGWTLCDALAESFPPQCFGGLPVMNYEADPDEVQESQGIRWTDVAVSVYGELVDGTLVVPAIAE